MQQFALLVLAEAMLGGLLRSEAIELRIVEVVAAYSSRYRSQNVISCLSVFPA